MTWPTTESFAGTASTAITALANGVTWVRHPGANNSGAPTVNGSGKLVTTESNVRENYYNSDPPADANQPVSVTWTHIAGPSEAIVGPMVRASSSTSDMICLVSYLGGTIMLLQDAGVTRGGTPAFTPVDGETYTATLTPSGTTAAGRLQRASDSQYLNSSGTWQSGAADCISATGITTTATGHGGLYALCIPGGGGQRFTVESVQFGTAASAPVITGPSRTPTGPTQATIACSTDTSGVNLYHLILPAATAAPANAAALIADIAAVSHTVSATGAQSYNITGLTTNTAVKVHFAQAGSNVSSSASFTPNTLAIAGTALSAQSGTAGGALTWSGATPESLITNTGNGAPGTAWSILSGAGASGCTVNASTGILLAATLGTAGSYTITLQRVDASTVPSAQTVTKTVGLTIGAAPATKIDLTIAAAASLTGIRWSVQSAAALAGSVTTIASGSAESFDGSGNISLDITGLSVPVGAYRYVTLTQSNGDPAQSPAPFGWHGPAIAS